MTDLMQKALAAVRRWPADKQEDAAQILLALDRLGQQPYQASEDELKAIDEALAEAEQDQFASSSEVEAAYARFTPLAFPAARATR